MVSAAALSRFVKVRVAILSLSYLFICYMRGFYDYGVFHPHCLWNILPLAAITFPSSDFIPYNAFLKWNSVTNKNGKASGLTINMFHWLYLLKQKRNIVKDSWKQNRRQREVEVWDGWNCRKHLATALPPCCWFIPLSPFCRALNGKRLFSCCFIKHHAVLFIAASPNSCTIPAEAFSTAADQTEKGQSKVHRCESTVTV